MVLALVAATAVLIARPFPRGDLPSRIDAALVLSGDDYHRLERAVALYQEGRVARLVLTGAGVGGDSALAMREFAIEQLGVPAEAILFEARSLSTRENLVFAAELLRQNRLHTVALVTSRSHMGRALLAARRAAPDVAWVAVPVEDVGSPNQVWRTRLQEWFKLAWYWLRGWV
jgi:uncharacterized SAM-binding protein YcdF (DUF218 family)